MLSAIQMPFFVLHSAQVHVDEDAIVFSDKFWADAGRSDTAQVEGSHRELRSRFTDRLSGDDTDSFAHADEAAVSEVDAVAFCANAASSFACQR